MISDNSSVDSAEADQKFQKTVAEFKNGRFINPYHDGNLHFLDLVKWNINRTPVAPLTPYECENIHPVLNVDFDLIGQPVEDNTIRMTWIGHSTFFVQFAGVNFLTDPVWCERSSPLSFAGPKRVRPTPCKISDLPPIDFVILSHNHYDHLDIDAAKEIGNKAQWFVPKGMKEWFASIGVTNCEELAWWEEIDFNSRLQLVSVPCNHHSQRHLFDRNKSLWCSWIVVDRQTQKKYYHSGDTAYCSAFKEVGHFMGPIDLSCIAIGAYEPRFFISNFHINPEEAVMLHQEIRSKKSVGMHWGTFILTDEPILEPPEEMKKHAKQAGLAEDEFTVMKIGETKLYQL
ncbi:beta-lactamase-like domain-containing protein [Heterostelium album PN500]|uniref:Beta-lactamase-like domain-containing protein n=1 Tax=Heterostelium pallidum (strain ATCC 26659 / Pp 5 / PN500) TaxID=670386 RepID=D3BMK7_HETP5|nr:beta-lactamase-like domain-containing protein [Heterostelium album PN500]EFA77219.1 beta-lactamase-like domain-containing protein [Heterostelium album PN500]|eukprot:XP_020429348.1 beta-lactamase-like domain-containing protein [Heterostelium album PN500]